jgi:hypothetical protein
LCRVVGGRTPLVRSRAGGQPDRSMCRQRGLGGLLTNGQARRPDAPAMMMAAWNECNKQMCLCGYVRQRTTIMHAVGSFLPSLCFVSPVCSHSNKRVSNGPARPNRSTADIEMKIWQNEQLATALLESNLWFLSCRSVRPLQKMRCDELMIPLAAVGDARTP